MRLRPVSHPLFTIAFVTLGTVVTLGTSRAEDVPWNRPKKWEGGPLPANASAPAENPTTFEVGKLKFERPTAWQWVPVTSPMRKAQLKIESDDKSQSADVTFFHFGPGMGGTVKSNADRWVGQFTENKPEDTKIETKEIAGTKVTFVSTKGVFKSGMPGGPTTPLAGYALLGAIIENDGGDIFIKMTGPAALVEQQSAAFTEFVTKAVQPAK